MTSGAALLQTEAHPAQARRHQVISDKYELLELMSSGGVGAIWVAHNRALANQVAVKLLHESLMCEELRDRLVREARLAARVEHPNIVRVLDLGFTAWNAPYIVMELLDGRDLGDELGERGKLAPVRAVQLLLPVLEGLAHAHDHQVVHRDIKPENIFLERSGGGEHVVPKLIDFGIARCLSDAESSRITRTGSVFGTVHYLSPEQALGQDDVDHRADIWSICAVLYECVEGQPPFGEREPGLAMKGIIVDDVPPPSRLGVDDQGLGPILMKGLARDRSQRWPDARSLGQSLSRWLIERGVHEDASAHNLRSVWFGSIPDTEAAQPVPRGGSAPSRREAATLVTPSRTGGRRRRRNK